MENITKKEYNDIPVLYCKHCLSLKIKDIPLLDDSEYCDDCGSTNIDMCHIEEWEEKYKYKYGYKFLDNY